MSASDKLFFAVREFLSDWHKGDFTLPPLAEHDANAMEDAARSYAASIIGGIGGSKTSPAKRAAARRNIRKRWAEARKKLAEKGRVEK